MNQKRTGNFGSLLITHAVGPVESVVELDEKLWTLSELYVFKLMKEQVNWAYIVSLHWLVRSKLQHELVHGFLQLGCIMRNTGFEVKRV